MFYNDHGLTFFLDKIPTFAVGAAPEYRNADEGWGIPTLPPFRGVPALSWHIFNALVDHALRLADLLDRLGLERVTAARWGGRGAL